MFNRTWNGWNTTMGMGGTGIGRWLRALGVGAALAATLPGCMAHARGELVYDYPVTYVDVAPARVETYPSTYYHGRPAYLVDGRWYYRSGPRWVYFREEPVELRTYRTRHYDHRGERYSDVAEHRRAERYREQRLAQERADRRRAEERREAQHRAEMRRLEQRRDAERRAEARRREERREAEARRAADQRRQIEERRAEQRRDEKKKRVADRHPNDNRRRGRDRDRDRDDRRD